MPLSRCTTTFALLAAIALAATGTPARAASLEEGLAKFKDQAILHMDSALAGAERMKAAVAAKDVEGAKRAWIESHAGWEWSETFTGEEYAELDEAIDAWPDPKAGYHAFEAKLFAGQLVDIGEPLDGLVDKLREFTKQLRAKGVTTQGLLNGTAKLAYETGEKKSGGGESAASGTSLDDMRNNIAGVDTAYTMVFGPVLASRGPKFDDLARSLLARMKTLLQAPDLKTLDQVEFGKVAERFAINLQNAAPRVGLTAPSLED